VCVSVCYLIACADRERERIERHGHAGGRDDSGIRELSSLAVPACGLVVDVTTTDDPRLFAVTSLIGLWMKSVPRRTSECR
jgi:hypothetical protein